MPAHRGASTRLVPTKKRKLKCEEYQEEINVRSLRYFLIGLILLLGISFSCLNAESININLYFQIYQLPLSLLLVFVLGIGMLVGLLGASTKNFQLRIKNTHLKNQLKSIEQEVSHLRMIPLKNND